MNLDRAINKRPRLAWSDNQLLHEADILSKKAKYKAMVEGSAIGISIEALKEKKELGITDTSSVTKKATTPRPKTLICFECGREGHRAKECKSKPQQETENRRGRGANRVWREHNSGYRSRSRGNRNNYRANGYGRNRSGNQSGGYHRNGYHNDGYHGYADFDQPTDGYDDREDFDYADDEWTVNRQYQRSHTNTSNHNRGGHGNRHNGNGRSQRNEGSKDKTSRGTDSRYTFDRDGRIKGVIPRFTNSETCTYFNRERGCKFEARECKFIHRCKLCLSVKHSEVECNKRRPSLN